MLEEDHTEGLSSDGEGRDDSILENVPMLKDVQAEKGSKKEKSAKGDKKKGKANKKKKEEEEEDLDAILAEIETSEKKDSKITGKKSKAKMKNKQEAEIIADVKETESGDAVDMEPTATTKDIEKSEEGKTDENLGGHDDLSEEEGPKMKTAAQKRAEKKEREKLKKKEAKKKAEKHGKANEEKATAASTTEVGEENVTEEVENKLLEAPQEGIMFLSNFYCEFY